MSRRYDMSVFKPYNNIAETECHKFIVATFQLHKTFGFNNWIHLDIIRRMYFHKSHRTFQDLVECVYRNQRYFGIKIQPINIVASIVVTKRYVFSDGVGNRIVMCGIRMQSYGFQTEIKSVEPIRTYDEANKTKSR